jgi:hypothetical protein
LHPANIDTPADCPCFSSDGLDDQLRKLYRAHAPDLNPFGDEDVPTPFDALDSFTKVLHLLRNMQAQTQHRKD